MRDASPSSAHSRGILRRDSENLPGSVFLSEVNLPRKDPDFLYPRLHGESNDAPNAAPPSLYSLTLQLRRVKRENFERARGERKREREGDKRNFLRKIKEHLRGKGTRKRLKTRNIFKTEDYER